MLRPLSPRPTWRQAETPIVHVVVVSRITQSVPVEEVVADALTDRVAVLWKSLRCGTSARNQRKGVATK